MMPPKRGRRLTFLNAYFTLVLWLGGGLFYFLILLRGSENTILTPLLWLFLVKQAFDALFKIIMLRKGNIVVDDWDWKLSWLSSRWGASLFAILLLFFAFTAWLRYPVKLGLSFYLLRILLPPWALLQTERAIWEWRAHRGLVPESEWVETAPHTSSWKTPPETIEGLRQTVAGKRNLLRYGPLLIFALLAAPGVVLLLRHQWLMGGLHLVLALSLTCMGIESFRKQARAEIRACEEALAEQEQVPPTATATASSEVEGQALSRERFQ